MNSKINKRLFTGILAFALLSFAQVSLAQQEDANIWTRVGIKYDLNKLTRISAEEELRFYENASRLEQNHTEIGLDRELTKRWEVGAYYRFIYESDADRIYSIGHRGWLQIEYLALDTDLEISLRTRLQASFKNVNSSKNGKVPDWYNRYKVGLDYKPKGAVWVPGGSFELWHALNSAGNPPIDKLRVSAGLEYRYTKSLRWSFFYAYQQELQTANPDIDHIFGLACSYRIN